MTVRFTENRSAPPAPAALLAFAAIAVLFVGPSAPSTASGPVAHPGGGAVSAAPPAPSVRAASTVEPTLPLRIDLAFESIERGGGMARGRLSVELIAIDDVQDLEIDVRHDDALSIPEASVLKRDRLRLRRGERRRTLLAIAGRDDRDLPLHLEATFRTAGGVSLRLGQGITLEKAKPLGEGRLHLGALEYPALVLDGPIP